MNYHVTLVAAGAQSASAVASRIGAFAAGLACRGWAVDLVVFDTLASSPAQAAVDLMPGPIRVLLERAGVEGDVMPLTGWRAQERLRGIRTGIAVISVPPFSLLPAAARSLPSHVPLVVDYRDPWNARHAQPLLSRVTRQVERRALSRARAVTYAGGPVLGELLTRHLGLPPAHIISVPNGFDPADLEDIPPRCHAGSRAGTPLDLIFGGYWYGRNGPGVLLNALAQVGTSVAALTVIGHISPPIRRRFELTTGRVPVQHPAMPRPELYRRLARADAAVITVDRATAAESRVPAKCYDCVAVGVPVIAICPLDAAMLQIEGAQRFHRFHCNDAHGLVTLLRSAAADRAILRSGTPGSGTRRDDAVGTLDRILSRVVADHTPA